jgi:hypothetical protein
MSSKALLIASAIAGIIVGTIPSSVAVRAQGAFAREAEMVGFHLLCDKGDRKACIQFGIMVGQNQERHAEWRRTHREWFWWEKR